MSVILLFNGHESVMRPQTETMPWPLLEVAGSTLAGYSVIFLSDVLEGKIIVVLSEGNRPVAPYLTEAFPNREFTFVHLESPVSDLQAIAQCQSLLAADESTYLISGDAIYKADFPALANGDAAVLTQTGARGQGHFGAALNDEGVVEQIIDNASAETVAVGAFWFKQAKQLFNGIEMVLREDDTSAHAQLWQHLAGQGLSLTSGTASEWENGLTQDALLRMNSRLLANNFGRSNALERSFGEGFTVLTPVYLADTAEADGAVLGPYVSIGENAFVKDAVVINSVISAGAHVEAVTIENSLIGPGAKVVGSRKSLFLGANEHHETS